MFAAWRAEGSAVNFAAAYGTDETLLGGADDVRTLQGTTARSARWKGFLSVGALFCCCQQLNFFVKEIGPTDSSHVVPNEIYSSLQDANQRGVHAVAALHFRRTFGRACSSTALWCWPSPKPPLPLASQRLYPLVVEAADRTGGAVLT
jgi:hypothetical protein